MLLKPTCEKTIEREVHSGNSNVRWQCSTNRQLPAFRNCRHRTFEVCWYVWIMPVYAPDTLNQTKPDKAQKPESKNGGWKRARSLVIPSIVQLSICCTEKCIKLWFQIKGMALTEGGSFLVSSILSLLIFSGMQVAYHNWILNAMSFKRYSLSSKKQLSQYL